MSFPRAKIQRFNDVHNEGPSPTRYDPNQGDKAKGGVINKEMERTAPCTLNTPSSGGTPYRTPFSTVKRHNCLSVGRGTTFGEAGDTFYTPLSGRKHQCSDGEDAAFKAALADKDRALATLKTLVEELNQQNNDHKTYREQLEQKIAALEAAKAELDCVITSEENCETHMQELTERLKELQTQLEAVRQEKDDLMGKWIQEETKILKLEDDKVEYEKRILSLEGSLEQVTMEHHRKKEEGRQFQETCDKLNITIKILQDEVSTLENKVCMLEAAKTGNEETISGLEERITRLNAALEDAHLEAQSQQEAMEKQTSELEAQALSLNAALEAVRSEAQKLQEDKEHVLKEHKEIFSLIDDWERKLLAHRLEGGQILIKKEEEICALTSYKNDTATQLSNMLEEVKLLKEENTGKTSDLHEMTAKFKEEWEKNEKLSEQLGALDSKVTTFAEELKIKRAEKEAVVGELKKARGQCNTHKIKILDLQLSVAMHQDAASNLTADLEKSRADFNTQLFELTGQLATVKSQCRKFEIAMADTRKSLEVLAKRLIESENEVEKLNQENEMMCSKVVTVEKDKNSADNHYRLLMEVKIKLEQRLQASETTEQNLRQKVQEIELKNCELELSRNEGKILKDTLEEDKKECEATLAHLKDVINEQNIQRAQTERMHLEQIEAVRQDLMSKFEEFEKFSTEKIEQLNTEIHRIGNEKDAIDAAYTAKKEEFENLLTDHDILKTTFDIATKETQSLTNNYEQQRIEFDNVTIKIADAESRNNVLMERLETINMTSVHLTKELEDMRDLVKEKETMIAQLKQEQEATKKLTEKVETAIGEKEEVAKKLTQTVEVLEREKEEIGAELLTMMDKKDLYKSRCLRLEERLADAERHHDSAAQDFDKIHGILREKEMETNDLKKRIVELETLIGPFQEQLEEFEIERQMLESDRDKLKRQHLEQAALLGHQNHRQKIKHVVRLKADILMLQSNNKKLQCELNFKNKLIEKLQEKVGEHPKRVFLKGRRPTSSPFKGKENDRPASPKRMVKQEEISLDIHLRDRDY